MNIFLVEDEPWALAELAELFKAYEPVHRIFAFDNGDDALSAAQRTRPHLILTDINMPGIDGLELIEHVKQMDPTIKCMILSVHDQFEYARQGMKFGVADYLLKPVKRDALYKAVDTALLQIELDSKRREEWMNGSITQMLLTSDIPQYEALHAVHGRAYCVILLFLEKGTELKSWKDAPIGISDLKKQFDSYPETEIHCVDLDCLQRVVLIPLDHADSVSHIRRNLSFLYRKLQQLPSSAHLGFAVKSENNTLYETFNELKQTMEEQVAFGKSSFLSRETKKQDAEIDSIWEKVRVMEVYFKKGDIQKGQAALHQILEDLRYKQITKRQLKLFIQDMLFSLKYNLHASKAGMMDINDLQVNIGALDRFSSYELLFDWLKETIVSIYCGQEPKDANPKSLIPVLLQLIHNNYQGNISLQRFAKDHHVSLGYLSRMFKSQTGSTFSEYIAGYRIRKAKDLLTDGIERLQEVCSLVGYEDSKHFSALFKRIVGETPITYAKRNAVNRINREK